MTEVASIPSVESAELRRGQMLIDGEWRDAANGQTLEVESPGTRTIVGAIARGGAADVDSAVQAARRAFPGWRATTPRERARLIRQIADRLAAASEDVAQTIALETGNALRTQARPEAIEAAEALHYFAGLSREVKGHTIPLGEEALSYTRREPLGVVGAIIPWNGPVNIACLKIGPALATGNTIVLKPAEDATLCVLKLAEICNEILPPGVVNVVTGLGEECGAALLANQDVDKLTFTGSSEVGRLVAARAAERLVPVSLELGGKSPCIVFPDSNTDETVEGVMSAMRFTRQSQSCTAGSRLFLHKDIYDDFLATLAQRVQHYTIGDPLDEATDVGTLINHKQHQRVSSYIEQGLAQEGGELVVGGLPPTDGPLSRGYFAVPTIFAQASNDWRLAREEIFGPVLVAIPWSDEEEVVRMANDSHYGLAAYVWAKNAAVAIRTAHRIESGWVQVNQGGGQQLGQPYGGYKQSGIGREFSLEGMLDSFTQIKTVTINLN
ncbi:aldehyde dehydrogenase family protein [Rhodococcus opacus]|uniref:aldehyde dehydrogenase family protein n=1 Tax=Rhodococcus opacus TaxID=37919 RepID=UPI001C4559D9|nr:aldehyde dehydrogenase family protein [Rhodococcus opacus]MBV6756706.1 aldehyde dehydrogenase family protein [Rhodococcus opacus]